MKRRYVIGAQEKEKTRITHLMYDNYFVITMEWTKNMEKLIIEKKTHFLIL